MLLNLKVSEIKSKCHLDELCFEVKKAMIRIFKNLCFPRSFSFKVTLEDNGNLQIKTLQML